MELYRRQLVAFTPAIDPGSSLLQGTDNYDGRRWSITSGTPLTAVLPLAQKCRGMKSAFVGGGAVHLQASGTDSIWRNGIEQSSLLLDAVRSVDVSCDGFRWEVKNREVTDSVKLLSWTTTNTDTGNETHYVISTTKALNNMSELVEYVNDKNTKMKLNYLPNGVLQVVHYEDVGKLDLTVHGVLVKQVNNSDADVTLSRSHNTTGVLMNIHPETAQM